MRLPGRRFFPRYKPQSGEEEEAEEVEEKEKGGEGEEEPCIIPNEPIYVITRNCLKRARSPSIILSTSRGGSVHHARLNLRENSVTRTFEITIRIHTRPVRRRGSPLITLLF